MPRSFASSIFKNLSLLKHLMFLTEILLFVYSSYNENTLLFKNFNSEFKLFISSMLLKSYADKLHWWIIIHEFLDANLNPVPDAKTKDAHEYATPEQTVFTLHFTVLMQSISSNVLKTSPPWLLINNVTSSELSSANAKIFSITGKLNQQ